MAPEFYLILDARELDEVVENTVHEAGFDDSELTMRGGRAAIWVCHREGELTALLHEAMEQARQAGLVVEHVEIDTDAFAQAQ